MSEKTYTEKEVVLRERAAFVAGTRRGHDTANTVAQCNNTGIVLAKFSEGNMILCAAREYPLPKVTRARVVDDPSSLKGYRQWRVVNGNLETRMPNDVSEKERGWHLLHEYGGFNQVPPTTARVALWADLLANPTEEVDA